MCKINTKVVNEMVRKNTLSKRKTDAVVVDNPETLGVVESIVQSDELIKTEEKPKKRTRSKAKVEASMSEVADVTDVPAKKSRKRKTTAEKATVAEATTEVSAPTGDTEVSAPVEATTEVSAPTAKKSRKRKTETEKPETSKKAKDGVQDEASAVVEKPKTTRKRKTSKTKAEDIATSEEIANTTNVEATHSVVEDTDVKPKRSRSKKKVDEPVVECNTDNVTLTTEKPAKKSTKSKAKKATDVKDTGVKSEDVVKEKKTSNVSGIKTKAKDAKSGIKSEKKATKKHTSAGDTEVTEEPAKKPTKRGTKKAKTEPAKVQEKPKPVEFYNEFDIRRLLMELGVAPNIKGYGYVVYAMELIRQRGEVVIENIEDGIYDGVAKQFNVTRVQAERNVRYLMNRLCNMEYITKNYYKVFGNMEKLSNAQFFSMIYEYFRHARKVAISK